jgi:hypothetical protein
MKSKYFNHLLIPVLFLLLAGIATLYFYMKLEVLIPVEQGQFTKLQVAMQSVNCKAINKEALLSIAHGKIDGMQDLANVLFWVGITFIYISIVNFAVIYKYLKPKNP